MTTASTSTTTVTERLADYVVGLSYEDLPASVVEKAKHHLAYLIGSAFRGLGRERGRQSVRVALELDGAGGGCSVVGQHLKANLLDAVFANSSLIVSTGLDDYLLPHGVHPGVVAQPVAWAFGERTGASGQDVLAAVVAGYDVMSRLCDPALTWGMDVYSPAAFVLEPFGAAATAARLLGLSREQTVHALGHAGQVGRPIAETGDHVWTIHPLVARNGGMAAMLAKVGMAAPSTVVEGEHGVFRAFFSREVPDFVEAGLATLGRQFAIAEAQTRRATATALSGLNIVPVELTQHLVEEPGLSASRVASIVVTLPEERRAREEKREHGMAQPGANRANRVESLRLRIAMTVAGGPIDPARFERPPDPDLVAVLEKVRFRFEVGRPLLYARVEVTTTNGDRYAAEGESPLAPPTDWVEWLAEGSNGVISEDQLSRLVPLIRDFEDVPDVSEVMACVVPEED